MKRLKMRKKKSYRISLHEQKEKLPHQFARAKKALSFFRYGAPAYQTVSLPGCKVSNTPSTAGYGIDVADTIASWVKSRVGIKKPTQKNPPKKTQKNPPKKTH
jgi:hypothetical protein